jgi:hypothetical protein
MKRFVPLAHRLRLASFALALVAASLPARAQESDKEKPGEKDTAGEKDRASDKDRPGDKAEKEKAAEGGAPEDRYPPFSTRLKVFATGLAITTAAWIPTFAASRGWPEHTCVISPAGPIVPGTNTPGVPPVPCTSGPPGSNQLGIPIAGPWIMLSKSGCASDEPTCSVARPVVRGIFLVIDGVVQFAGLGLLVEALVMKTESMSRPDKKSSALALRYRGVEVTPVPLVAPGVSGLSVVGSF